MDLDDLSINAIPESKFQQVLKVDVIDTGVGISEED